MQPYEQLLEEASACGITVVEMDFESNAKGLIKGSKIGIRKQMSSVEKRCTLVEELKHFKINVGDILNLSDIRNKKQEMLAKQRAFERLVPLSGIAEAYHAGISGRHDLAEFLDVTEEVLGSAIERYMNKYGKYYATERYIIHFDPLYVLEIIE